MNETVEKSETAVIEKMNNAMRMVHRVLKRKEAEAEQHGKPFEYQSPVSGARFASLPHYTIYHKAYMRKLKETSSKEFGIGEEEKLRLIAKYESLIEDARQRYETPAEEEDENVPQTCEGEMLQSQSCEAVSKATKTAIIPDCHEPRPIINDTGNGHNINKLTCAPFLTGGMDGSSVSPAISYNKGKFP